MSIIQSAIQRIRSLFTGQRDDDGIPFQSESPDDLMNDVQKELEKEMQRRAGYEKSWFLSIAFILGKHYIQWSDTSKQFINLKVPDWRVRLVVNKILPRYRQNLALLSSYDPKAVCTPNSKEIGDIEAAELGTKILTGSKDKLKMKSLLLKKSQWQLMTGNGFLTLPYWDSNKGDEINEIDPETGEEIKVKTGDIGVEAVSTYELYPIGRCTGIDDCQGMIWAKQTTLAEIRALHPDSGAKVTQSEDDSSAGMYMDKIDGLVSTSTASAKREGAMLYVRVWLRPTPAFPKGRYIAYANSVVLEYGDIPNIELGPEYEIPFLKYDDISVPGRFWAQSTVEQAIPVNKELDKTRSQLIEDKNLVGKPKWIAVKGTVASTAITTEPGEVIEWDPTKPGAQPPSVVTPPSLPSYIINLCAMLERDIADIFASHEATMGSAEPGVESGKAIRELKASDIAEKGTWLIQEVENKKIFNSALLKLVQVRYKETRLLKIMGADGSAEAISFEGANLRDNTDVWVETSDIIPIDREARQALILTLFEKGLLGDQMNDETRKRALRMLQFGAIDEMWDDGSLDAKIARRENNELLKGNLLDTNIYDGHITHISEHMKGMKTPRFSELPDEIQAMFIAHVEKHQSDLTPPTPPPELTPEVAVNPAEVGAEQVVA